MKKTQYGLKPKKTLCQKNASAGLKGWIDEVIKE